VIVPTIPTPFIGGSDGPRPDTEAEQQIAAPFYPEGIEATEQAAERATEAAGVAEGEAVPTEPALDWLAKVEEDVAEVEAETEVEPGLGAERAETEALEQALEDEVDVSAAEEIIPIQVVEADEIARAKTVALGTEDELPEVDVPAPVSATVEEAVDSVEVSEVVGEAADTFDFPDFLAGPDGADETDAGEPLEVTQVEDEIRLETGEELEELARELQEGDLGAWIRTLIDDLRPYAAEIVVARAFAAGYLAAHRDKDKDE
jgi:hypothetical protein